MKTVSIVLIGLLIGLSSAISQAQDIYMKITPYSGKGVSPTENSGLVLKVMDNGKTVDMNSYIQVSSLQYDTEQTLNIGSQSSGAGAGKIAFNPLTITKIVDQASGPLFTAMALGQAYQTVEFIFVRSSGGSGTVDVIYKLTLKLAAVKKISIGSVDCSSGCTGLAESVSFEYGGLIMTTYTQSKTGQITGTKLNGWNRVKNVQDNDPSTTIP